MADDPDRLIINKWTVLDRLSTMRALSEHFIDHSYEYYDTGIFVAVRKTVDKQVQLLIDEIQIREGRKT